MAKFLINRLISNTKFAIFKPKHISGYEIFFEKYAVYYILVKAVRANQKLKCESVVGTKCSYT